MSKKNVFLLALGYIAGGVVASLYNNKKPGELKKDIEKSRKEGEGDFKVIVSNFIDTHASFLEDLKAYVMTEKNKSLFNEKKDEILNIVETYKKQGLELSEELKVKGKEFITDASKKLETLYEEKKDEIDAIKEVAPKKVQEIKDNLKSVYEEVKNKLKEENKNNI